MLFFSSVESWLYWHWSVLYPIPQTLRPAPWAPWVLGGFLNLLSLWTTWDHAYSMVVFNIWAVGQPLAPEPLQIHVYFNSDNSWVFFCWQFLGVFLFRQCNCDNIVAYSLSTVVNSTNRYKSAHKTWQVPSQKSKSWHCVPHQLQPTYWWALDTVVY